MDIRFLPLRIMVIFPEHCRQDNNPGHHRNYTKSQGKCRMSHKISDIVQDRTRQPGNRHYHCRTFPGSLHVHLFPLLRCHQRIERNQPGPFHGHKPGCNKQNRENESDVYHGVKIGQVNDITNIF